MNQQVNKGASKWIKEYVNKWLSHKSLDGLASTELVCKILCIHEVFQRKGLHLPLDYQWNTGPQSACNHWCRDRERMTWTRGFLSVAYPATPQSYSCVYTPRNYHTDSYKDISKVVFQGSWKPQVPSCLPPATYRGYVGNTSKMLWHRGESTMPST